MNRQYYIYALVDPDSGLPRYVGKAKNPQQRLKQHLWNVHRRFNLYGWLRQLRNAGKYPILVKLQRCGEDWRDWERHWIAKLKAAGYDLLNMTGGGDGWDELPPESRKRIAEALRGRQILPEWREKISRTLTGRKMPEEQRQKMLGRKLSSESVIKRSTTVHQKWLERQATLPPNPKVVGTPEWRCRVSRGMKAYADSLQGEAKQEYVGRLFSSKGRENYYKSLEWRRNDQSASTRARRAESLRNYLAALTPEQRTARMAKACAARKAKLITEREQSPMTEHKTMTLLPSGK